MAGEILTHKELTADVDVSCDVCIVGMPIWSATG